MWNDQDERDIDMPSDKQLENWREANEYTTEGDEPDQWIDGVDDDTSQPRHDDELREQVARMEAQMRTLLDEIDRLKTRVDALERYDRDDDD